MISAALWSVAVLLALAPAGIALSTRPNGSRLLYGACLVVSVILCVTALVHLLDPAHRVLSATLPRVPVPMFTTVVGAPAPMVAAKVAPAATVTSVPPSVA